MTSHIVLGAQWGDEGKGVVVDFLASTMPCPFVIRFNGGHQCGHTVTLPDGRSHVFSNYGSGTLRGAPTYFSEHCVVDPVGIINEGKAIHEKFGIEPKLYIDSQAMVVTPFDKLFNRAMESLNGHGSVGVGFGVCVERNMGPCKLHAIDLLHPQILTQKLMIVGRYYYDKLLNIMPSAWSQYFPDSNDIEAFIQTCKRSIGYFNVVNKSSFFDEKRWDYSTFIFEGGQGIMLDMDHGVFPNMTRSNTTSKNALELLEYFDFPPPHILLCTRAYATRHGNGWFPSEQFPVALKNNEKETNVDGGFQGTFRTGILNLDTLMYARDIESIYSGKYENTSMMVSCMDQIEDYQYISNGKVRKADGKNKFLRRINDVSKGSTIFFNISPCSETMARQTIIF